MRITAHLSLGVRLRKVRTLVVRSLPTGPHWRSASFDLQFTRGSVRRSAGLHFTRALAGTQITRRTKDAR